MEYGRDNGIRSVCRVADARPGIPGEFTCRAAGALWLDAVRRTGGSDYRSNTQVRSFTYDDKYRGRGMRRTVTGPPEIRYRYDSDGRVTEQLNPAGLSYTYQYEKDRITITDSLDRREVLHTQGEAGLKRVAKRNTRTAASRESV